MTGKLINCLVRLINTNTTASRNFLLLLPLCFVSVVEAAFIPVDIAGVSNYNIQDRKNPNYPDGHFVTSFGVPFDIGTGANNAWGSGNGISGAAGNHGLWSASVDVYESNVRTIYTLADTDWGLNGLQWFSITANFDNGNALTWQYTDGQQLRDWNLFYADQVNGTDTNEVFRVSYPLWVRDGNPDVLDMQTLHVPETYHDATLETLELRDYRQTFTHSVFVTGITLSDDDPLTTALNPVPLPPSFLLMLAGVALASLIKRKRLC
jgi:hypothetical protein